MVDNIFEKSIKKQFKFNENIALVFNDMLNYFISYYKQIKKLTIKFDLKYLKADDLGYSTASMLIKLGKKANFNLNLIGIDNSSAIIKKAQKKSKAFAVKINSKNKDLLNSSYKKAQVIIPNYKQCIDIYHNVKQIQGYSEYKISQKKEALENVLIPYTHKKNKK